MSDYLDEPSVESDMLLMHNAIVSLSETEVETEILNRLTDTSENVADLIDVVPSIESASDAELYLLSSNAYMATAGTDLTGREVARKLSPYRGKRVSVEGFKNFLSSVWRTILGALKRAWDATSRFFNAVFGLISRLRFSMKRIREKLDENPGFDDKRPMKFVVKDEIYCLATENKAPKTLEKINETMDVLGEHVDFYFGEFLTVAKQVYSDVITGMEHFDGDHEDTVLNQLSSDAILLAQRNYPPMLGAMPARGDTRFNNDYLMCPPLPNNKSIVVRRIAIPDSSNPLQRANAIMMNTAFVLSTKPTASTETWAARYLNTPDSRQIKLWLDRIDVMLNKVEEFQKGMEEVDGMRHRLVQATDDLIERMEDLPSRDANLLPYYRCAVRYNSYLSTAFIHPCTQVMNIAFSACRAVIVISQKAMKTIEPVVRPT